MESAPENLQPAEPPIPKKRGGGGCHTHKKDRCMCSACIAFRRKTEALTFPDGVRGDAVAMQKRADNIINGDFPIVVQGVTARDRILQWAAWRATNPELSDAEIARKIGITPSWLSNIKQQAVKEGWLKFENPLAKIEYDIIPKVVDNLSEFLTKPAKESAGNKHLRAKVTLETAKNTILKEYTESKGIKDVPTTVLALKIETSDPEGAKVITGNIVGAPRVLDAEVVEE